MTEYPPVNKCRVATASFRAVPGILLNEPRLQVEAFAFGNPFSASFSRVTCDEDTG
jgi:hypothetical protein